MEEKGTPTNINISISITKGTLEKLDDEARKEIRTRSNMVEVLVLEAIEARKNRKQ